MTLFGELSYTGLAEDVPVVYILSFSLVIVSLFSAQVA